MQMKSSQSEENTGQDVAGSTRTHVISKLNKAARYAKELYTLLQDSSSGSTDMDLLEVKAYYASLVGAAEFEKQSEGHKTPDDLARKERWNLCLQNYAVARIVYAALQAQTNKEVFKDFLNNTVDPTIRYAAYQARLPRTIAVSTVATRYYPKDDAETTERIKSIDYRAFDEEQPVSGEKESKVAVGDIPKNVTWRGRKADIVDAAIGQALAQVSAAEARLAETLKSKPEASSREKAAAYDEVLIASQDAADATHQATVELEKEGVDEGDARMQNLRVSNLAVNYELVSWRVGRNRVLIGSDDGLTFTEPPRKQPKRARRDGKEWTEKSEPRSKKLARLRERVVLYDASMQSIDTVKDLRGAMRDNAFVSELEGKRSYFQALKCLNIGLSYSLLSNHLNALALFSRASELASVAVSNIPDTSHDTTSPPTLDVHPSQAQKLQAHAKAQVQRYQAIADLQKFHANAAIAAEKNLASAAPLVQRLDDFPTPGVSVDLKNLVSYPPKIEPVPMKPLFFDVAWNYIEYPGRAKKAVEQQAAAVVSNGAEQEEEVQERQEETPKKRGWFGFGR